jgi:hypothetical protein
MTTKHKNVNAELSLDDSASLHLFILCSSDTTIDASGQFSSGQTFSVDDIQSAGLSFFTDSILIPRNSAVSPTKVKLPVKYTNAILGAVERYIQHCKTCPPENNSTRKRQKTHKTGKHNSSCLSDVFKDNTLDELYLIMTFAHEFHADAMINVVAYWLVNQIGLETLVNNPPLKTLRTPVGIEIARIIDNEQKLRFLQLGATTNSCGFQWLEFMDCFSFDLPRCRVDTPVSWVSYVLQYHQHLKCYFPSNGVKALTYSRELKNNELVDLSMIGTLEHLEIKLSRHTIDVVLKHITKLSNLKHVEVKYFGKITDSEWSYIAYMPKTWIWHFDLSQCDTDFEQMAKMLKYQVQSLGLSDCDLTDDDCVHIGKMSELRDLDLTDNYSTITRACLKPISKLLKLHTLRLYECFSITDADLEIICLLLELQCLELSSFDCEITDVGAKYMSGKLLKLQSLDLQSCFSLTDAGLTYLAELPALRYLDVSVNCIITPECIEHIKAKFPRLGLEHT